MLTIPWQQSALDYGVRLYNPLISLPSMTPEPEPHGQRDHFLSSSFFFFQIARSARYGSSLLLPLFHVYFSLLHKARLQH